MRNYTTAPPFEKPTFIDGRPVRDWTAEPYTPSDAMNARMARAARRAAAKHAERGEFKKAAQQELSASILDKQR
jgi:hypothetical protein